MNSHGARAPSAEGTGRGRRTGRGRQAPSDRRSLWGAGPRRGHGVHRTPPDGDFRRAPPHDADLGLEERAGAVLGDRQLFAGRGEQKPVLRTPDARKRWRSTGTLRRRAGVRTGTSPTPGERGARRRCLPCGTAGRQARPPGRRAGGASGGAPLRTGPHDNTEERSPQVCTRVHAHAHTHTCGRTHAGTHTSPGSLIGHESSWCQLNALK